MSWGIFIIVRCIIVFFAFPTRTRSLPTPRPRKSWAQSCPVPTSWRCI